MTLRTVARGAAAALRSATAAAAAALRPGAAAALRSATAAALRPGAAAVLRPVTAALRPGAGAGAAVALRSATAAAAVAVALRPGFAAWRAGAALPWRSALAGRGARVAAAGLLLAGLLLVAGGGLPGGAPPAYANQLTVTGVAITSSPAEGDDYHAGETITVRVTFSETITGWGDPTNAELNITVGTGTRMHYSPMTQTGHSSNTVDFDYVVHQHGRRQRRHRRGPP